MEPLKRNWYDSGCTPMPVKCEFGWGSSSMVFRKGFRQERTSKHRKFRQERTSKHRKI